jgi:hypothetical protein
VGVALSPRPAMLEVMAARSIACVTPLLLAVVIAGCITTRVTTIGTFAPANGRFSVTVPSGTMDERTSAGAGPFAAATIHAYIHDEDGGPRFAAFYGDADPGYLGATTPDAALDTFEASNISATGGRQVSERHLTVSGFPAREQAIAGAGGSYVFRMILAGNRLFSFSVKGSDPQVHSGEASVYLDSIAVTT